MPKAPLFLFAPGAGAPSSHPWIVSWAERLKAIGPVVTFDYRYRAEKRARPDPLPLLIETHRSALAKVRGSHDGPIVLIGKSMGSRVGCHVSLVEPVDGLVSFGYPLCGGGDPAKLRDKVLRDLTTPILFIQGTRDSLCPLESLEQVRAEMTVPNELHIVPGGDHSLLVSKSALKASGQTQEIVDNEIFGKIAAFAARCEGDGDRRTD